MDALQQSYIISDAPGKGMGMFATRDIMRGECVVSERPLVYVSPNLIQTELAINAMAGKDKESFFSLRNVHHDITIARGIVKTNALPLGVGALDGAVFKDISRINHSCAPNVHHAWSPKTRKEFVHATDDISAGSEILTSYVRPYLDHEDRKRILQQDFKFDCNCHICAASSTEYESIVKRIRICSDLIVKCASSNPRRSIQFVREVLDLLDQIGGSGKTPFYYDGYQISAMYSDYNLAQEWANLLLESYRMTEGEDGERYERYLRYSRNPRSHERAGCSPRQILS